MCPIPAWFPSSATSTLRAASERHSVLDFLGGHRWFETAVHPNSIKQPHRCSMATSERPFKPSVVPNLSFNRRRRHIPVQSSRWKLSFLADHIGPKSIFTSFRYMSLRITLHEPSYTYGEAILRWGWLMRIILEVWWLGEVAIRWEWGKWWWLVFPGYLAISGVFTLTHEWADFVLTNSSTYNDM